MKNCPKCGGKWGRKSGFTVCTNCGHQYSTQHPERFKSEYGQVLYSKQALGSGEPVTNPVDDEEPMIGFPKGRRNQPLDFE